MKEHQSNILTRLLRKTSLVAPNEISACVLSFLMVFLLMGSYYIIRPVRDGMASDWSDAELSFLWTLNFLLSTAAVAVYGMAVKWIRFDFLIPGIYAIFALSFATFYFGSYGLTNHTSWINKSFYIMVSIFSLFNISVFWSFMADIYSKEQASRLFPVIGAGASAGALLGPAFPTLLTPWIGIEKLMLLTAFLILPVIPLAIVLLRLKATKLGNLELSNLNYTSIGGNPFAGFYNFFTNRYLLAIGMFITLYSAVSSILYFQQKNMLEEYTRMDRTQILGAADWIVNILTFVIAFFATGRIVKYWGMPLALSFIPFATACGMLALAIVPILLVVLGMQVVRRVGEYAVTKPSREMLFTLVDREDRFKTKPVIDIVAYRGGDTITSWGFAALTEGLGFGLPAMAAIGAIISGIWGMVGIYLGNWFRQTEKPG